MAFIYDTPTAILVRQVLGAIAEFKTTLVAKLAAARRRKRVTTGEKIEGRKSHAELCPDVVKLAKALRKPKGGRLSLRAICRVGCPRLLEGTWTIVQPEVHRCHAGFVTRTGARNRGEKRSNLFGTAWWIWSPRTRPPVCSTAANTLAADV